MSSFEYDYINFADTVDDNWFSNECSEDIYGLLCSSDECTTSTDMISEFSVKSTDETSASSSSSGSINKQNYVVKSFRKSHDPKVIWSLKNSKKGKTYEDYIVRQLRIARRLCKQAVKLFNDHDIESFIYFAKNMFVEDIVFREKISGVNPFNKDQTDSDRIIQGLDNLLIHFQSYITGVPDSAVMVDHVEVLSEGKRVVMKGKCVGTPLKHVVFPEHIENPPNTTSMETKVIKADNGVISTITHTTTTVTSTINTNSINIDYSNLDNIATYEYPITLTFLLDKRNKLKRLEFVTD